MYQVVLDDIRFHPDLDALAHRLHVTEADGYLQDLRCLAEQAETVARPKAMYKVGFVEARGEDTVVIDGVTFTSRILSVNLERAHRVFLYVATCGTELEAWARSLNDLLHRYWADAIQEAALREAGRVMHRHMVETYRLDKTATMAPGSLSEWPLTQQRPLFACLGDVHQAIGVRLSDGLLMVPSKSVSGIRFPTVESFESCQLCPRENCPGRRAPYDQTLWNRRYRSA
jgi:hypothetical protein